MSWFLVGLLDQKSEKARKIQAFDGKQATRRLVHWHFMNVLMRAVRQGACAPPKTADSLT